MSLTINLSLDLDNKWTYLKTAGRSAWKEFPSYLPFVCQQIGDLLEEFRLRVTIFVVGQDLLSSSDTKAISELIGRGHDIGNHSFHHEPWLHLYDRAKIAYELDATEELLSQIPGQHSLGFRGPGYSDSPLVHEMLAERGYRYCASQFSSFTGPLARQYYFLRTGLSGTQRQGRERLFGGMTAGMGPNRHWRLAVGKPPLWMVPVTVIPGVRTPFHFSYLQYFAEKSPLLARVYLASGLRLCKVGKVQPSLLLHPLDFLGCDDEPDLGFFPGMRSSGQVKRQRLRGFLQQLTQAGSIQSLGEMVAGLDERNYWTPSVRPGCQRPLNTPEPLDLSDSISV
jgi:hypothetical protein